MAVSRRTVLGLGLAVVATGATGVGGLAATGKLDRAESHVRRRLAGDVPNAPPPDAPAGGLVTGAF